MLSVAMSESVQQVLWDRSAYADLWSRTLSPIPTLLGRLVCLAALRDANTDRYSHHGLGLMFGEEEAERALREAHIQAFADWLGASMEQHRADLELYLAGLGTPRRGTLQTWHRLAPYRNFIPSSAGNPERMHFLHTLETLVDLIRNEDGHGPDASRRRSLGLAPKSDRK